MKIDFTPRLFYDLASTVGGVAGGANPVGLAASATGIGLGLLQGAIGLIGTKKANRNLKRLFSQRKAFQTPKEIMDILGITEFNAQTGFDSSTIDFLTGSADRRLASGLGAATRLGADPNDISGIIDQHFQDIFKIGTESDLAKANKVNALINAKQLVADNKSAEWQSRENLIKDQMQMEGQKAGAAQQNIQSGVNLALGGFTSLGTQNLWKNKLEQILQILAENQPTSGLGNGVRDTTPVELMPIPR